MSRALHVLVVEDVDDDAVLLVRALESAGWEVVWRRVDGAADLAAALAEQAWDVVTCDWTLPGLGGERALAIIRDAAPAGRATPSDAPIVVVSGTLREEDAVAAMHGGADDFVTKARWDRLPAAIERAAIRAAERIARQRAQAGPAVAQGDARGDAHKLEVLARLSGGLADDFDRILTLIGSHAAALAETIGNADVRAADLHELIDACGRAAELARRLHMFGRREPREPRALPPASASEPTNGTTRAWETVLLVGEDASARTVMRIVLSRAGYRVIEATTPQDALRLTAAGDLTIDLVITDLTMTTTSGPLLVQRLRATRPALRVLYMSGYHGSADVRAALVDPRIDLMRKPFRADRLLEKVRELCDLPPAL